jgi:hypothetical protein
VYSLWISPCVDINGRSAPAKTVGSVDIYGQAPKAASIVVSMSPFLRSGHPRNRYDAGRLINRRPVAPVASNSRAVYTTAHKHFVIF